VEALFNHIPIAAHRWMIVQLSALPWINIYCSRIYGRILAKLVELEHRNMEMEEQAGFRAGRSCIDNIFCITQMIEKKKATNRELHLLFIDLTKAYDSIPLNK